MQSTTNSSEIMRGAAAALLAAAFLVFNGQSSIAGDRMIVSAKIAFIDFDNEFLTVTIDRKLVFSGFLVVSEKNDTIGLSAIIGVDVAIGKVEYEIESEGQNFSGSLEIHKDTEIIYIGRNELPEIQISNSDILLLD